MQKIIWKIKGFCQIHILVSLVCLQFEELIFELWHNLPHMCLKKLDYNSLCQGFRFLCSQTKQKCGPDRKLAMWSCKCEVTYLLYFGCSKANEISAKKKKGSLAVWSIYTYIYERYFWLKFCIFFPLTPLFSLLFLHNYKNRNLS